MLQLQLGASVFAQSRVLYVEQSNAEHRQRRRSSSLRNAIERASFCEIPILFSVPNLIPDTGMVVPDAISYRSSKPVARTRSEGGWRAQ